MKKKTVTSRLRDVQDRIIGIFGIPRDISARKQAEDTVAKHAAQLATVARISLVISAVLDLEKLLLEVVNLTKEQFNLYHAHIYLLNDAGDALMLTAGAGEIGLQMVAKNHSIPLNRARSLVARAAREKQGVIINDVTQAPDFLPNLLLPDTRSELAMPLIVGGQLLGVFDIQSDEVNHFTQQDVSVQTILAAQIAVAIRNAQEFAARKQAKDELSLSKAQLLANLDNTPNVAVQWYDKGGKILYWNPASESMYGWKSVDAIGKTLNQLIHTPEEQAEFMRILAEIQETGKPFGPYEAQVRRKDGSTGWVLATTFGIPMNDEQIGFVCMDVDINESKRLEHELQDERDFALQIINAMGHGLTVTDEDGRFVLVNPAYARFIGYEPLELIGKRPQDITLQTDQGTLKQARIARQEGKTTSYENQITRRDGINIPVLITGAPRLKDGKYVGSIASITDLTEIKRAEKALRQSEEKFSKAFRVGPAGMTISRVADGVYIDVNEGYLRMLEYTRAEIVGHTSIELDVIAPDERRKLIQQFLEQGSLHSVEIQARAKSGRLVDALISMEPVEIDGEACIVATMIDITERKRAQAEREKLIAELEVRNAESETLREGIAIVVGTLDLTEIVARILDQIRRVVPFDSASVWKVEGNVQKIIGGQGLPDELSIPEEGVVINENNSAFPLLEGRHAYILYDDVQLEFAGFRNLPHNYIHTWLGIPLKVREKTIGLIALDGRSKNQFTPHHAELALTFANQVAIALENARLFAGLQSELAERKKLIEELTNKNAELESFIYIVSHDLKSPLVTMKGFLGYLERDAATGNVERLKADTQRISNAVDKMSQLLSDVLELSRIGRFINPSETVPFEELTREAIGLVADRIQECRVAVTLELQPNLPLVHGDRRRLIEVLQNLLDKAVKYMDNQSSPRIEIGQRGEEDGKPLFYVKDNGMGIAPEYRERVFGLFNKLDARSEGTGIGLALVKRIVEFHGGRIWVESEAGMGSTFLFTLPSQPKPDSVI